jgi:heme A synthase
MARSTWIARRIGIGLLAVTLALGGLLSHADGTFARVGGKMHLEDISLG